MDEDDVWSTEDFTWDPQRLVAKSKNATQDNEVKSHDDMEAVNLLDSADLSVGTQQALDKEETPKPAKQKKKSTRHYSGGAVCQVRGCGEDLSACKAYYQKYRICREHSLMPSLTINGEVFRFCQQCGRFQELADFDADRRTCRAQLSKHNARRRRLRSQAKALQEGSSGKHTSEEHGEQDDEAASMGSSGKDNGKSPSKNGRGRRSQGASPTAATAARALRPRRAKDEHFMNQPDSADAAATRTSFNGAQGGARRRRSTDGAMLMDTASDYSAALQLDGIAGGIADINMNMSEHVKRRKQVSLNGQEVDQLPDLLQPSMATDAGGLHSSKAALLSMLADRRVLSQAGLMPNTWAWVLENPGSTAATNMQQQQQAASSVMAAAGQAFLDVNGACMQPSAPMSSGTMSAANLYSSHLSNIQQLAWQQQQQQQQLMLTEQQPLLSLSGGLGGLSLQLNDWPQGTSAQLDGPLSMLAKPMGMPLLDSSAFRHGNASWQQLQPLQLTSLQQAPVPFLDNSAQLPVLMQAPLLPDGPPSDGSSWLDALCNSNNRGISSIEAEKEMFDVLFDDAANASAGMVDASAAATEQAGGPKRLNATLGMNGLWPAMNTSAMAAGPGSTLGKAPQPSPFVLNLSCAPTAQAGPSTSAAPLSTVQTCRPAGPLPQDAEGAAMLARVKQFVSSSHAPLPGNLNGNASIPPAGLNSKRPLDAAAGSGAAVKLEHCKVLAAAGGLEGASYSFDASADVLAITRLSIKLHGVTPDMLPADLYQRLQAWVAKGAADILQGAIRPGCTQLVLDLLGPASSCFQLDHLLAKSSDSPATNWQQLLGAELVKHGKVFVQSNNQVASLHDGSMQHSAIAEVQSSLQLPVLHKVSPMFILAGDRYQKLQLFGENLDGPNVQAFARSRGQFSKLVASRPSPAKQDDYFGIELIEVQEVPSAGICYVECQSGNYLSNCVPVLVLDDPKVLEELQQLQQAVQAAPNDRCLLDQAEMIAVHLGLLLQLRHAAKQQSSQVVMTAMQSGVKRVSDSTVPPSKASHAQVVGVEQCSTEPPSAPVDAEARLAESPATSEPAATSADADDGLALATELFGLTSMVSTLSITSDVSGQVAALDGEASVVSGADSISVQEVNNTSVCAAQLFGLAALPEDFLLTNMALQPPARQVHEAEPHSAPVPILANMQAAAGALLDQALLDAAGSFYYGRCISDCINRDMLMVGATGSAHKPAANAAISSLLNALPPPPKPVSQGTTCQQHQDVANMHAAPLDVQSSTPDEGHANWAPSPHQPVISSSANSGHTAQDVQHPLLAPGTRQQLAAVALRLLAHCCDCGWPETATLVMSILMQHIDSGIGLEQVMNSAMFDGLTLLHRAVRSGSVRMVFELMAWADAYRAEWNWSCRGGTDFTPLHVAATLPDNGAMALKLLRSGNPAIVTAWYTATAADGFTPLQYANLMDCSCICPSSSSGSSGSSRTSSSTTHDVATESGAPTTPCGKAVDNTPHAARGLSPLLAGVLADSPPSKPFNRCCELQ